MKCHIANEAQGSCMGIGDLASIFECDEAEAMDAANEHGVYLCNTCGWWHEENDIYSPTECDECHVCEHKNIVFSFEGDYCSDCDEIFFDNTGEI